MQQYIREDGIQCQAIQFVGHSEGRAKHVFEILNLLNYAKLKARWIPEEITDEWEENEEGDDYVQIKIPEHIYLETSNDKVSVGDYVAVRDDQTYFMNGDLFEGIWKPAITNDVNEWDWVLNERLPYSKKTGFWRHKKDPDVVSMDGGVVFFRRSETPIYKPYGKLYKSVTPIGG